VSTPADTVTQSTAVDDQMEEQSMSLLDNTGKIQCIIIIVSFVMYRGYFILYITGILKLSLCDLIIFCLHNNCYKV